MNELHIQDKFLIPFFTSNVEGLGYREVKANTISNNLFIEEDLLEFLSSTTMNKDNYKKLLKKFSTEKSLIKAFIEMLTARIKNYRNMALFINANQSITFEGLKFYIFYVSGSQTSEDKLFDQNIFSVVQELPYKYHFEGRQIFSFRPDITIFVNGIYLGYSELKSNYNNQNAKKNGRIKVIKDYREAAIEYFKISEGNDKTEIIRKDFLKIFEKAIHLTSTDLEETYIIRNISNNFETITAIYEEGKFNFESYTIKVQKDFKPYPLLQTKAGKREKLKEIFAALYSKKMIEKEILYYNFIEREVVKTEGTRQFKNEKGYLISPRPKQKFGVDKIMGKIDEFLQHEQDDNYFINKLKKQLTGVSEDIRNELIEKRMKYKNNKTVYSLLMQYAAGFGKSNIIGWSALQLKDIKRNKEYVYDKIMLIVDRLQLRDQLDRKMFNMNVDNRMYVEATDKASFLNALQTDTRLVIVNLQKFGTIKDILEKSVLEKLAKLRIVFLIDEIHRSHSGDQHEEMINLFDLLQESFDSNEEYQKKKKKKNLIIGFTATPSDNSLARFGEYNKYAEGEKIWVPFDSYTMKEAIEDGYILNPLKGLVPVSAKMFYELPEDLTEGVTDEKKKYRIIKKKIYENEERIDAISKFIVDRLVHTTYKKIRGTGKAMLAVSSIKSAIKYKDAIEKHWTKTKEENKFERFKNAPIYIVYSDNQEYSKSSTLNNGMKEHKVLQNFALAKNGLIIVVDKLQTGFDEPKLHTLFLDKEIRNINAIQTISRVNRTTKYKEDCKIIDFSYRNVNINNIKKAFEHFSDIVVSDFDPFGELKRLIEIYKILVTNNLFIKHFKDFKELEKHHKTDVHSYFEIEESFTRYIRSNPEKSKKLKKQYNRYFSIINLIEYVIEFDKKYSEKSFLEFWRRYNNIYNNITKPTEEKDDVEIYFNNQIGIVSEPKETKKKKPRNGEGEGTKHKYNILKIIEQRNKEEETIGELIKQFEEKIDKFFEFIKADEKGKRLILKIQTAGSAFGESEILADFEKIYNKYKIRFRKKVGEFFFKQTQDLIEKLFEDFEESVLKPESDAE